jgi:hypothetical protein
MCLQDTWVVEIWQTKNYALLSAVAVNESPNLGLAVYHLATLFFEAVVRHIGPPALVIADQVGKRIAASRLCKGVFFKALNSLNSFTRLSTLFFFLIANSSL